MAKLILFITPQIEHAHEVGESWVKAGATGATYIESHGLHRLRQTGRSTAILPGMSSVLEILRSSDQHNITMLTVVQDDSLVDKIVQNTEALVGSLDHHDNGVMFILDVERALGLRRLDNDE